MEETVKIFLTGRGAVLGQWLKGVVCPGCLSRLDARCSVHDTFDSEQILQKPLLRGSVLNTYLLVTAQHSEPYRKMGRMQVLYSLVEMVILDFQI